MSGPARLPDGVLVVDKPPGPTSFDVVRRLKHAARLKRVGHPTRAFGPRHIVEPREQLDILPAGQR